MSRHACPEGSPSTVESWLGRAAWLRADLRRGCREFWYRDHHCTPIPAIDLLVRAELDISAGTS